MPDFLYNAGVWWGIRISHFSYGEKKKNMAALAQDFRGDRHNPAAGLAS